MAAMRAAPQATIRMVVNPKHSAEERAEFSRCINDLNRILDHAPIWRDSCSAAPVLRDLLDMLVDMLDLDFAYVRLKDPITDEACEMARSRQSSADPIRPPEVRRILKDLFGPQSQSWPSQQRIAIGKKPVSALALQWGLGDESGTFLAASRRAEFPEEGEALRLRLVAAKIEHWAREARLLNERKRVSETIDHEIAEAMEGVRTLSEERRQEIIELRRVVESLRVREIDIQMLADAVPAPMAILTAEGRIEAVNHAILDYFGKSIEELKQWSTIDVVHPDDLQSSIAAWTRAVESEEPYEIESRYRGSDGVYRWFHVRAFPWRDVDGHLARWCVLQIDIEDRKCAENALKTSERNLNLIINTIPAFVWCARPDGSAEFFNQHYLTYMGVSSEMAQDWGWTAAVHPDDLNGLASAWQSIRASRQAGEKEARLRRFDGTYRWFLFRANPLCDEFGSVIRWFGINTDIEDRKRAEGELRDTQAKLAHMARVMTIGELTASIAHEISQPLSGIVTNASTGLRMLAADPPNVVGARETARRTIRDGNRVSDIIGRLRALFNRKAHEARPVDLNEAAREVIALSLDRLRRDSVRLKTELAGDLPLVVGDRVQLQQVILNLVQNALDAMSTIDDQKRELTIRTESEDRDRIRLSVRDSGPGLDPAALDRLFDAFYTTKDEGMGIGLSVSRSIIENHHGRLWAAPNDGPGATFSFSVPRTSEGDAGVHVPGTGAPAANEVARNS